MVERTTGQTMVTSGQMHKWSNARCDVRISSCAACSRRRRRRRLFLTARSRSPPSRSRAGRSLSSGRGRFRSAPVSDLTAPASDLAGPGSDLTAVSAGRLFFSGRPPPSSRDRRSSSRAFLSAAAAAAAAAAAEGQNGRDSNSLQRRNCGNCRAIAPLPRPNCTAIGGRRGCGGARTRRSRAPIMRRYCGPVAVQSKRCCCAVARLLPCYCGATLLQRCCRTVASYCRTDAALLQHCCGTVAALLQHCCSTIAANAPGFEGGGGGGGLGWACRPASESPSRRPILQSLQVLQLLQLLQPPSQI